MKYLSTILLLGLLALTGCQQAAAPAATTAHDPMFRVENWCQYNATVSANGSAEHYLPALRADGHPYYYEQAVTAGDYQLTVTIDAFGNPSKVFTVTVPPTDAGITFAIPVYPSVDWN